MTLYNLSNLTDSNSTLQFIKAIDNDITGGWFAIFIVIALAIIVWINIGENYPAKHSFLIMTFIASIVSGGLWLAGLLPFYIWIITVILVFIAINLVFFTD